MSETKQITRPTPYADPEDFRRVFDEDMNSLYLLSFLLTANHEKAEQCFVSGLEDAVDGNPVFREWARSWARRMIVINAVKAINPRPTGKNSGWAYASVRGDDETPLVERIEISSVLGLEPFERFVYVMTILERCSDQECSLLLGCARWQVVAARTRAFEQIGTAMTSASGQLSPASSEEPASDAHSSSLLALLVSQRLATSA